MGIIFFLSGIEHTDVEQVYHVALVDFVSSNALPEKADPAISEQIAEKIHPPEAEPSKKPEVKTIRARKPTSPMPMPTRPEPEPAQAQSGQTQHQVGDIAAYEPDQVDQRPAIIRIVEPEYPLRARRMNIEGTTVVELIVDTDGLPKACTIRSAAPPGYFEGASLHAAQRMRFMPGKLHGRPVNTIVLLPFAFRLR